MRSLRETLLMNPARTDAIWRSLCACTVHGWSIDVLSGQYVPGRLKYCFTWCRVKYIYLQEHFARYITRKCYLFRSFDTAVGMEIHVDRNVIFTTGALHLLYYKHSID